MQIIRVSLRSRQHLKSTITAIARDERDEAVALLQEGRVAVLAFHNRAGKLLVNSASSFKASGVSPLLTMDASSRKAAHPAPAPANAPSREAAAPASPRTTSAAPAPAAAAAAPAPTTSLRVGARFPASSNLGFHRCCALARHETAAKLQAIRVAAPSVPGNDKPTGLGHAGLDAGGARLRRARLGLCGNNQCVGCTRQFFTKSFLGDDAAVLARSGGEEPASPRHRAGVASMAWRTTRRFRTNAP